MDLVKDFINPLKKKLSLHSQRCIGESFWPKELKKAAIYSLSGGKKMRPLFFLALLGQTKPAKIPSHYLDIAIAIEFIHAYSLIQDDFPSMDNDDFRRGRPSLHKAFPEAVALLTSDAMITKVFQLLSTMKQFPSDQRLKLIELFSLYSGGDELIHGQYLDLFEKRSFLLEKAFLKKTSSLFILSFLAAAILKNIPTDPLKKLGANMGLLYQFLDDYSNLFDPKYKKRFFPMHACSKYSQKELCNIIKELYVHVIESIDKLPLKTDLFKSLALQFLKIPKECHE